MTLDTSGYVGIGTSPTVPLQLAKAGVQLVGNWYSVADFRDASVNKGIDLGYDNTSQTSIIAATSNSAYSNLAFWNYGPSGW